MARYPVPQFIEQEGKIIFFLTYRQFFVLVGGGAVCIVMYFILPVIVFLVVGAIVMGLAGIIAFAKINNSSVVTIFMHFIGFSMQSKTYAWKKQESLNPVKIQRTPEGGAMQPSRLQQVQKIVETKK